jgi:hypothetical protein
MKKWRKGEKEKREFPQTEARTHPVAELSGVEATFGDTETRRHGEKETGRFGIFRRPKPELTRWLSGVEATNGDLEKPSFCLNNIMFCPANFRRLLRLFWPVKVE